MTMIIVVVVLPISTISLDNVMNAESLSLLQYAWKSTKANST